ncbi:MAG: hypothetical protein NUV53_01680, partial [Patescibacteria group bacterium]|nr:hypothetical protein [Patescibacteria group bacterium]
STKGNYEFQHYNSTADVMYIDATNDRVGIGTTGPSYKLQVQKTSTAAPAIMVGGAFAGGPRIQTYGLDADSQAWMGLGTDMAGNSYEHDLYFSTGSSGQGRQVIGDYNGTTYNPRVTILATSGNVGIGTAGPNAPLQIHRAGADSTATNLMHLSLGHGTNRDIVFSMGRDDAVAGDYSTKFTSRMSSVTSYASTLQIQTHSSASGTFNTGMFMDTSGNVGIGTTGPTALLSVGASNQFTVSSSGAVVGTSAVFSGGSGLYVGDGTSKVWFGGSGGKNYIESGNQAFSASALLYFTGYNAQPGTFAFNGNVGIGTTSPGAKLDVVGRVDVGHGAESYGLINWAASDPNNSSYMFLGMSNEAGWFKIGTNKNGTGTQRGISFITGGGETVAGSKMVIDTSGNVGIGTTAPSTAKLQVASTPVGKTSVTGLAQFYVVDPATNGGIKFAINDAADIQGFGAAFRHGIYTAGSESLAFITNNLVREVIDTNGNVGIGMTAPGYALDVYKSGTDGSSGIRIRHDATGGTAYNGGLYFSTDGGSPTNVAAIKMRDTGDTYGLDFFGYTSGSGFVEKMTILGSGNVGIGTTSPSYKLDIASGGATTARVGATSTDVLVVGGGAGKITAGTFDPVFTIEGINYATYSPDNVGGVRTQTTGKVALTKSEKNVYTHVIAFGNESEGSDLWLFKKTSNFGVKTAWNRLSVFLTPEGEAKVWYELNPVREEITLYADRPVSVSYQLSAPRVDYTKWGNLNHDGVNGIDVREFDPASQEVPPGRK